MQIRPVHPDEHEAAGRVVVAAYGALAGGHLSDGYAAELADVSRRVTGAEVLVAVDDGGDVIGCVTFVPDAASPWAELLEDGEAAIRMLGVQPGAQGCGVGRRLVESCLDRARRLDRRAVLLHTTPWMPAAHRIYDRAGFTRLPERDWQPTPDIQLLAYRLALR